MAIFSFKELDGEKRLQVYDFIKEANELFDKSFVDMEKFYLSEVFNNGDTLIVSFYDNKILGTIGVIIKEVPIKGEAFITEIFMNKDFLDYSLKAYGEHIVNELLHRAINICEEHGANKISLGIKNKLSFLEGYILDNDFFKTHEAIIMKYTKKEKPQVDMQQSSLEAKGEEEIISNAVNTNMETKPRRDEDANIDLLPLSEETLEEFMAIHNDGFKETPNAATLSINETRELFHGYMGNEDFIGIVKWEKQSIGVYMLAIADNVGWIDNIAILEEFRSKNFGKLLLNKSIDLLKHKDVESIKLLVMSSNTLAYKFYKKYGFEEEQVYSTWYEKN
ncbi:GNAT family N-acetyltransferase [Clostridium sp.]|uniref:GNAT family N-acetyltransferase n=1 Tax=Clostridium sp. TaxID=1506 RepID=UPI002FC7936B